MKFIFLDFNGTIINDLDLCLQLLNEILKKQNKPLCDINKYKNIFTFPIKKYYELAGIDFSLDSYEDLAIWFISKYQPMSMSCGLFTGIEEAFLKLKEMGYHLVILSASERNNLIEQCQNYDIVKYFDDILGIDNIHAASKVGIALDYMQKNNIDSNDVLMVGDTLHDLEVAKAIGANAILVSCGHQSIEVLKQGKVQIINDVCELPSILEVVYGKGN